MSKTTRNRARKNDRYRAALREANKQAEQERRLKGFKPASVGEMVDAVRNVGKPPKDIMVAPRVGR
jgi:hypothetical protein